MMTGAAMIVFLNAFVFIITIQYEIMIGYNCGSSKNDVKSGLVTYSKDQGFSSNSKTLKKQTLPYFIQNQIQKQLLWEQRTSQDSFYYSLKLQKNGNYLLMMKFLEVLPNRKGQRVFNVRIGDQVIMTVDIVNEVGVGKVLEKWFEFEVIDEIIYIDNGSYPVLNGFIIKDSATKVHFEKVRGMPKLQAIFLVKGKDLHKFLDEYLTRQTLINSQANKHVSEKFKIPPKDTYPALTGHESFLKQQSPIFYLANKIFSYKMLVSILVVFLILYYQKGIQFFITIARQKND